MATLTTRPGAQTSTAPRVDELARPRAAPVKWWAMAGAAFVALQIYVYTSWIVSGDARRVPTGADDVPWATEAWAIAHQIAIPLGAAVFVAWVVRGCLRERRFTFDAMFVLAWVCCFWQDPILNYVRPQFFYNSVMVNLGSWTEHIPGWISPNGRFLPEPIFFTGFIYVLVTPMLSIISCTVMRTAKQRWPNMSAVGLVAFAYASMVVFEGILEVAWVRTELMAFSGTIHDVSFFGGQRYQFPIYESLIWGAMLTAMGALRYFRDDKGRSVVERGVDRVKASSRQRTVLRTFAVIGFANIAMLAIYNIPMQWFALHVDKTPAGYPTYMRNGICGEGTTIPCPAPDVPVPLPESGPLQEP
jgi:Spirocyclase AveC-like